MGKVNYSEPVTLEDTDSNQEIIKNDDQNSETDKEDES